jgi:hypothetical protein
MAAILLCVVCVVGVSAQFGYRGWGQRELTYDGRFTFVRLRWTRGTFGSMPLGRGINMWLHEFPSAEANLMSVLGEYTAVNARTDTSLILSLDDDELFRYPAAMMWEPGFWVMTDEQAGRLRDYMHKGGVLIFNDFEGQQWENFEAQLKRVLPDAQLMELDGTHPVFNLLFEVGEVDVPNPPNHHLGGLVPKFFGVFEENNPSGRMLALVNYDTNLGEYWQLAGTGLLPFEAENHGFQLGINYMLYGMTH